MKELVLTHERLHVILAIAVLLAASLLCQYWLSQANAFSLSDSNQAVQNLLSADIRTQLQAATKQLHNLQTQQTSAGLRILNPATCQSQLDAALAALAAGNLHQARRHLGHLTASLQTWNEQLTTALATRQQQADIAAQVLGDQTVASPQPLDIPILLYHKTPADFETQLTTLLAKNYTVVSLDQVAAALAGRATLPSKPVAITFDDGFADQLQAADLLAKYRLPATFYIITGGAASNWCIGAGRRYNDPAQPPQGCGDAYLSWDQIRDLDRGSLITIGGHTVDHFDLTGLSSDDLAFQISEGKHQIEAQLGHPIYHFAYPYGAYNDAAINAVRSAGYATAVTTQPGTWQSGTAPYSLLRLRDPYELP